MVEGKAGNSLVGVALSLTERQFGRWVRMNRVVHLRGQDESA